VQEYGARKGGEGLTKRSDELRAPDFRALFDAVPGLYLVLLPNDPIYTIVATNHAYAEATLINQDEVVGRGLFEVFPDNPDDPQASGMRNLQASLRLVLATKARHTMPVQRYDIRGSQEVGGGFEERYWSPINSPLLDDDGEVQVIIHRVEDITELVQLRRGEAEQGKLTGELRNRVDRMEAELFLRGRQLAESKRLMRERQEVEDKLLASEARFSLAFAQAPIGMVLLTPDGRIVEMNQAFLDMLGYTREDLTSHDSSFYTHADDITLTKNFFAALKAGPHNTGSIEKRYVRKDGELLWSRASATMRRDDLGRPAIVIAIVENITERKRAEERYRFLAESIPQMVWTATPDGMLDYVNGQGTAYFGVPQEALLGAGWLERVHPAEKDRAMEQWKYSLETGAPYETSFRLKRGIDGSWRWHLVRALPLAGDNANITQWFGTCTDIEQQRRIEEELRRTNRELEEFAYVASHDLQEPLRMVNIYTQLILKNLEGEKEKLALYSQFVQEGVKRMEALIQDLLAFSRTVHSEDPPIGTAELSASFSEALSVLKGRIEEVGAVIQASTLPAVRGDASQFTHVFQNVLSNALKYRKKDIPPEIQVSAKQDGDRWIISVQDNGIGFEPKYAERIFGLFKRLHKDEYAGTGLGLAICKRIVERYGGRMWAESRLGSGATFYFSLPCEGEP
jgi:PAS domain S-box-containing protein